MHAVGSIVRCDGSVFEKYDGRLDSLEFLEEAPVALSGATEISTRGGRRRISGPPQVVEPQSPIGPTCGQGRLEIVVPDALLGELGTDEYHGVAINEFEWLGWIINGNGFGGADDRDDDEDEDEYHCTEPWVSGHGRQVRCMMRRRRVGTVTNLDTPGNGLTGETWALQLPMRWDLSEEDECKSLIKR